MKFLFSELFWGSLLILSGLSIVLKILLKIDIPVFRILMAIVLIYGGITLIIGPKLSWCSKQTFMFTETSMKPDDLENYTTAFSKMTIDLTDIRLTEPKRIKINTIFGQTTIKINKNIPTEISVNASFANAELPNKATVSFGSSYYKTAANNGETNRLSLETTVVFGNLEIIEV